jgi:hypothetical protein
MINNETSNITYYEAVKLELLDRRERLNFIKKLLINLKGLMVMDRIVCTNCLTLVNPLCDDVLVNVRGMTIGAKSFKILEPSCPVCGTFITSDTFIHIEN